MPAKDGTGPEGRGPLTGRGLGPCEDDPSDTVTGLVQRLGRGFGRLFKRGRGRGLGIGRGQRP